jgi:hypothetical protein
VYCSLQACRIDYALCAGYTHSEAGHTVVLQELEVADRMQAEESYAGSMKVVEERSREIGGVRRVVVGLGEGREDLARWGLQRGSWRIELAFAQAEVLPAHTHTRIVVRAQACPAVDFANVQRDSPVPQPEAVPRTQMLAGMVTQTVAAGHQVRKSL